ncbi:MAG: hypothetical protein RL653_1237 [Pseudomonadota bacterium]|jgi:type IV secretory pathway VirB10-like protein
MDQNAHPSRKVAVADHIWDAFEQMAQEMGSSRDGLINQAMFMFARLNGFLEAGRAEAASAPAPRMAESGGRTATVPPPAPPPQAAPVRASPPPPPPQSPPARTQPPRGNTEDDSQRRGVAERVLETAAELERMMIMKKNPPQQPPEEELVDEPLEDEPMDEPLDDEPMDDLEPMADDLVGDPGAGEDDLAADDGGPALYMTTEAGNRERITKERFVIGRGKHCDFVINSGKVSREHAQIILDNGEYYIEDLGSSNGTWFQKQRIKRRKIEDGDEYLICNEKVKLALR